MSKLPVVEITIPNDPQFVAVVRLAMSGVAARMNFNVDDIENIKLAVSEAVTNAVQYAYPEGQAGTVTIRSILHPDQLEIVIQDHGNGFDSNNPKSNAKPKSGSTIETLGLGVTFIRCLMDDVEIDSAHGKGTTVKMVKKVPLSNLVRNN